MRFAQYEHYRPVRIGWFNEVPSHWEVLPLKRLVNISSRKRDVVPSDNYIGLENVRSWTGEISNFEAEASAEGLGVEVQEGDVLFGKLRPYLAKVALARTSGIASTEFLVLRGKRVMPSFLRYSMLARQFIDAVNATTYGAKMPRANWEDIGSLPQAVPPLPEQEIIADFLDHETAKIDDLIAKQQALVRAASQKQIAEGDTVLTRGIMGGELRASPVPWLGEAPSDWKFVRAKFLFRERSEPPLDGDGVVTAFRDGQVTLRSNRRSEGFTFAELEVGYQRVYKGDLVIHTMDAFAGAIGVSESDGKSTGEYAVCVPIDSTVNNQYYAMTLRIMARRGYIYVLCPSVRERAPRFRFVRFADTLLPVPPRAEQDRIVSRLEGIQTRYRSLIERCEAQVRLLRERRSALIAAAVTGQIDARLPSTQPLVAAANDNRHAMRVVVGAEIISRHASAKAFGRVKFQKLLYLAEVHAGLHELAGGYSREAAGPLARDLLSDIERGMAAAGYYSTVAPLNAGEGYTYSRLGKLAAHREQLAALLGERTAALSSLIDRLKDYDTRQVEAITTLYAVWNDALLDGEKPDDDRIVRGVLEEWHPEKADKFSASDLRTWLGWMRRNGLVPTGTGSRTQIDRLFV